MDILKDLNHLIPILKLVVEEGYMSKPLIKPDIDLIFQYYDHYTNKKHNRSCSACVFRACQTCYNIIKNKQDYGIQKRTNNKSSRKTTRSSK